MRKRNKFFMVLAGLGAASGMALTSCNDYTTGQPGEPEGPLRITRLTAFDGTRGVFTDTSSPRDCMDASVKDTEACFNNPFTDKFGTIKSPPTPDSGGDIRVVFNKLPLRLGGADLQKITKEMNQPPTKVELAFPDVIKLECSNCSGVPSNEVSLQLSGSELSPDPTGFPYGPSIQIVVGASDSHPLAALEPETAYKITVDPKLQDRNGNAVELNDKTNMLLQFTTEPFRLLQLGIGDTDNDATIESTTLAADYTVDALAFEGVIAISLNASVDPSVFKNSTVTAKVGNTTIPAKIGVNQITKDDKTMKLVCDPGTQRSVYVYPTSQDWSAMGAKAGDVVEITISGGDVRDISQAAMHPAGMGRHTLKGNIVIKATLSGPVDPKYTGLTSDSVAADEDCPTDEPPDMMMTPDLSAVDQRPQG